MTTITRDELRAEIDKALHIDWAFKKSKPTRIIIDGSATKGAYHTDYNTFVSNMVSFIDKYTEAQIDKRVVMVVKNEVRHIVEGDKDGVVYSLEAIGKRAANRLAQLNKDGGGDE